MRILASIFLVSFSIHSFAQTEQKEIVEQVWKPYIAASNGLDGFAFMALHSKDVVRASSDNGSVMGYEEYSSIHNSSDHNFKVNKFKRKTELRFTEHWVNQNLAYEVGVIKITTIRPSGNTTATYGKFHVILRKENGVWKILTDTDSSDAGAVSEKEFLSAVPLDI
jgi:ketosteroid isomerase-like protein